MQLNNILSILNYKFIYYEYSYDYNNLVSINKNSIFSQITSTEDSLILTSDNTNISDKTTASYNPVVIFLENTDTTSGEFIGNKYKFNYSDINIYNINSIINYKNYYDYNIIDNYNVIDISKIYKIINRDIFYSNLIDTFSDNNTNKNIDGIYLQNNKILITNLSNIKMGLIFYEYAPYINGSKSHIFTDINNVDAVELISSIYPLFINYVYKLNSSFETLSNNEILLTCSLKFRVLQFTNLKFEIDYQYNNPVTGSNAINWHK